MANKASALIQQFSLLSRVVFVGIGAFLTLKLAVLTLGLALFDKIAAESPVLDRQCAFADFWQYLRHLNRSFRR